MDGGRRAGRVSLLGRSLGRTFERRIIDVPPGSERVFHRSAWRDEIVVVERGAIELESERGTRVVFPTGAVIFLHGLRLRALRNRGRIPVVLSAVSRRRR